MLAQIGIDALCYPSRATFLRVRLTPQPPLIAPCMGSFDEGMSAGSPLNRRLNPAVAAECDVISVLCISDDAQNRTTKGCSIARMIRQPFNPRVQSGKAIEPFVMHQDRLVSVARPVREAFASDRGTRQQEYHPSMEPVQTGGATDTGRATLGMRLKIALLSRDSAGTSIDHAVIRACETSPALVFSC